MKTIATAALIAMTATTAMAETVRAKITRVEPNYGYREVNMPVQRCENVEVPVYGTVQGGGATGGDVLGGMIIGGLLGKGVTGKDDGAAAGAVLGGIIAADKANKPKTETVITGYKTERQCENVTEYKDVNKKVYDYSIITWTVDGITYQTTFVK